MANEKRSIKSLTQLIKEGNRRKSKNTVNPRQQTPSDSDSNSIPDPKQNNELPSAKSVNSNGKFLGLINEVNKMDHYGADAIIYIDQDIHEIFTKLKYASKIKISHLASFLLENFIRENIDAISEIISKKSNKFL